MSEAVVLVVALVVAGNLAIVAALVLEFACGERAPPLVDAVADALFRLGGWLLLAGVVTLVARTAAIILE